MLPYDAGARVVVIASRVVWVRSEQIQALGHRNLDNDTQHLLCLVRWRPHSVLTEEVPRLQVLARFEFGMLDNRPPKSNRVTLPPGRELRTRQNKRTPWKVLLSGTVRGPLVKGTVTEKSLAYRIRCRVLHRTYGVQSLGSPNWFGSSTTPIGTIKFARCIDQGQADAELASLSQSTARAVEPSPVHLNDAACQR